MKNLNLLDVCRYIKSVAYRLATNYNMINHLDDIYSAGILGMCEGIQKINPSCQLAIIRQTKKWYLGKMIDYCNDNFKYNNNLFSSIKQDSYYIDYPIYIKYDLNLERFILKMHGLSNCEIAKTYNISSQAVDQSINKIRNKLQNCEI